MELLLFPAGILIGAGAVYAWAANVIAGLSRDITNSDALADKHERAADHAARNEAIWRDMYDKAATERDALKADYGAFKAKRNMSVKQRAAAKVDA